MILISNICLYFISKYKKEIKKEFFGFEFKNSDNFTFFLSKKIYNKYYKDNGINKNETFKISINCVDTHNYTISNNLIKDWFKNQSNFIFEVNTENPDFLFYDVWGIEHLNPKYNNSTKIASYSENYIPDLNQADYALSQSHIMYLDRYLKFPIFIWIINKFNKYDIRKIRRESIKKTNKKFCAAVISSNQTSEYFRFNFINELNKYKKIDMGGRAFNNVGGRVKNKIEFLSNYKFSFSMENTKGDGYISEKIIDSFIAGTIPIYYGDYMIDEFINPKTFILVNSEQDLKKKIEYIKKIDNDDALYKSILKERIFNDNYNIIMKSNLEEKIKFLRNIFIQGNINSKRVDDTFFYLKCFNCKD